MKIRVNTNALEMGGFKSLVVRSNKMPSWSMRMKPLSYFKKRIFGLIRENIHEQSVSYIIGNEELSLELASNYCIVINYTKIWKDFSKKRKV